MIDESDLLRLIEGTCTPTEAAAIQKWVAADPARGELLAELRSVWALGGRERPWDLDAARKRLTIAKARAAEQYSGGWQIGRGRIRVADAGSSASSQVGRWTRRASITLLSCAAAVLVFVAYGALQQREIARQPDQVFRTVAGQRAEVSLPDGSRVMLAANSQITWAASFGSRDRTVALSGEGYFTVRHDASRPFRVRTARGVAEVLGTEFDLRDDGSVGGLALVVTQGSVSLRGIATDARGAITLRARDRATINAQGVASVTSGVPVARAIAWTRGQLVFNDASVDSVAAELGRWYGLHIALADPTLRGERVTVVLTLDSADDALSTLAKVLSVKVVRAGQSVRLISGRSVRRQGG